jgi:hypothetical protein
MPSGQYCGAYQLRDAWGGTIQQLTPVRPSVEDVAADLQRARGQAGRFDRARIIDLRTLRAVEPWPATMARLRRPATA